MIKSIGIYNIEHEKKHANMKEECITVSIKKIKQHN